MDEFKKLGVSEPILKSLEEQNISVPTDRVIYGVSLKDAFFQNGKVDRECYFLYRSKWLQAVRCGAYKAHYFTSFFNFFL